jgi:geranylgeranyl diphosphate synthase, type II
MVISLFIGEPKLMKHNSYIQSFLSFLEFKSETIEIELKNSLGLVSRNNDLGVAISYSLLSNAKRIRPLLCIASNNYCGGDEQDVLPIACAIEMVHTASLIHDDLPAMDNSDYRRGQLANHKANGESLAILAGDALLGLSYSHLIKNAKVCSSDILIEIISLLSSVVGPQGLPLGQALDMKYCKSNDYACELEDINEMYAIKTGLLLEACVEMVSILNCVDSRTRTSLKMYSKSIGIAYQITDDILDSMSSLEKIGKNVGTDVKLGKINYIDFYSLDECVRKANHYIQHAIQQIDQDRPSSEVLIGLAEYIIHRLE